MTRPLRSVDGFALTLHQVGRGMETFDLSRVGVPRPPPVDVTVSGPRPCASCGDERSAANLCAGVCPACWYARAMEQIERRGAA
jgi:hypothetical protein